MSEFCEEGDVFIGLLPEVRVKQIFSESVILLVWAAWFPLSWFKVVCKLTLAAGLFTLSSLSAAESSHLISYIRWWYWSIDQFLFLLNGFCKCQEMTGKLSTTVLRTNSSEVVTNNLSDFLFQTVMPTSQGVWSEIKVHRTWTSLQALCCYFSHRQLLHLKNKCNVTKVSKESLSVPLSP